MFRRKYNRVHFEQPVAEPADAEFIIEFSKYNQCSLWLVLVFLMTGAVQFCIDLDRMVIQSSQTSEVTCVIPENMINNWTDDQMVKLLYPPLRSVCMHYIFDASLFENKSFDEAFEMSKHIKDPVYDLCSLPLDNELFSWDAKFIGTCKGFRFRHRLFVMSHVGSALGHFMIGILADLYGRKVGFYVSLGCWIIGITVIPLTKDFRFAEFIKMLKGFGNGGLFLTSMVLFMEVCNKYYRGILTIYITSFGPIGELVGIILKHDLEVNVQFKYALSLPSILLIYYAWYMCESPKWYLSYGQKKKAWNVLKHLGTETKSFVFLPDMKISKRKVLKENFDLLFTTIKYRKCILLCIFVMTFIMKIGHSKKMYLTLRSLRVPSHRHLIILAELASFMYVLPPLIILGRHLALCWFFTLMLFQLFISLFVTSEAIYILNILTVLVVHALEMVMVLYICEIFPTCARCTSIGLIYSFAQIFYLSHSVFDEISDKNINTENAVFLVYTLFGLLLLLALPYTGASELPDQKRYRNSVDS